MSGARFCGGSMSALVCGALAVSVAWGGGIYLVEGRGLEHRLEIAGPAPKDAQPAGDGWYRSADLEFRTASGNLRDPVVLIRCRVAPCLTDRGVRVGDSEADVLRRYGAPKARSGSSHKALVQYRGVGFLIEASRVAAIYVLPP